MYLWQENLLTRKCSPRNAYKLDVEYCVHHGRAGSIVECLIGPKLPVDPLESINRVYVLVVQ